ncbi:MAG: hypothetical protein IJN67_11935 [Oscillospiraceae bacterium]|nr:hypothetical protein [Oscillospiraceae bacterium]
MAYNANKEYMEKVRIQYDIAKTLEQLACADFANLRDICRFSPDMFLKFQQDCAVDGRDLSLAIDGIYNCRTDAHGREYFVDCNSGLVLLQEDSKFAIAKYACTSKHYDIFDAAYLRNYIAHPEKRKWGIALPSGIGEITTLDYLGLQVEDVFSTPILEYSVSTRRELNEVISEITSILSESKFFCKLWFRGQRKEYENTTTRGVARKIGFPEEFDKMPSLVPSAGRLTDVGEYKEMRKQSIYWNQAFKVWLLSQLKGVVQEFKIDGEMYKEMLRSLEPDKMIAFLNNNPYDIEEYVFEQDREPMWASVLASQQYGGCTSMLDITDDVDVALFFTQSYLNRETGKYELCEPNSSNVIYLLATTRNSCTIDLSKNIFESIPYAGTYKIPPRIFNQHCGLLRGSDMFSRNTYAYRILARIKFSGNGVETTKTVDEMFPSMEIDTLYKTYSYAEPKLTGLYG